MVFDILSKKFTVENFAKTFIKRLQAIEVSSLVLLSNTLWKNY
jgi:hypothetical protein